jgi:hypothetical protein
LSSEAAIDRKITVGVAFCQEQSYHIDFKLGRSMKTIEHKKLPSFEQVEAIIDNWGKFSVEEFSARFQLEEEVIESTIEYLRRLKRTSHDNAIPVMTCYRDDTLESIVRCAGARRGFI